MSGDKLDAAVAQVERRFAVAISAIDGFVWTNNAIGEMVGEQPGWATLTGQTFDEYQGYGWSNAVHPDDAQPTIDAWQVAVEERRPFVFEHRVRRADGEWRSFAIRALPIEDGEGAIIEWLGVHRDITNTVAHEERLRHLADTFAGLFVSNPFGVYIVDADFKIAQVSQGGRKAFEGIDPLIGRDFGDVHRLIWPEPFASELIERFRHTLTTGEPYASEDMVETRDDTGEIATYDWRIERIMLPDGRHGVVCYFYDLSEQKAQARALERAIAEKDLLAREIDHRVKNSLTIVASLLSMQGGDAASPEVRTALTDAADRVSAVARLHENLYRSHELGIVAFGNYLSQLAKDLKKSIGRATVKLAVEAIDIKLPADTAIPLALTVNELVTNAFKHGVAQGAREISVVMGQVDDRVRLTVSDDGAGFPETANGTRSGIGLTVVQALATQLDADLTVPAPGAPATFIIEFDQPEIVELPVYRTREVTRPRDSPLRSRDRARRDQRQAR